MQVVDMILSTIQAGVLARRHEHGIDEKTPLNETELDAFLAERQRQFPDASGWRTSITDLMMVLHVDPSIESRRTLATELGYEGDMTNVAALNNWLHAEIMRLVAERYYGSNGRDKTAASTASREPKRTAKPTVRASAKRVDKKVSRR